MIKRLIFNRDSLSFSLKSFQKILLIFWICVCLINIEFYEISDYEISVDERTYDISLLVFAFFNIFSITALFQADNCVR